jgi:hypothetical protein
LSHETHRRRPYKSVCDTPCTIAAADRISVLLDHFPHSLSATWWTDRSIDRQTDRQTDRPIDKNLPKTPWLSMATEKNPPKTPSLPKVIDFQRVVSKKLRIVCLTLLQQFLASITPLHKLVSLKQYVRPKLLCTYRGDSERE